MHREAHLGLAMGNSDIQGGFCDYWNLCTLIIVVRIIKPWAHKKSGGCDRYSIASLALDVQHPDPPKYHVIEQ